MKLDLNFNPLTKLKDWWKQVHDNFSIIEAECTQTRKIADNACTKEQAQAYVAEFAGATGEYMEAMQAFNELYQESGDSTQALEELFGERTAKTDFEAHCGDTEIHHTHDNKAALDEISDSRIQLWDTKSEVVFGVYEGDGNAEQFIDLGFTPVAVEVYSEYCSQGVKDMTGSYDYTHLEGGFVINGYPLTHTDKSSGTGIERTVLGITVGGFQVSNGKSSNDSFAFFRWNLNDGTHYFKAYKYGEIRESE